MLIDGALNKWMLKQFSMTKKRIVILAQAGIQPYDRKGPRLRGGDKLEMRG